MRRPQRSDRGSALLIVLGLLGFLLISAVAFSISMRTEKSAAAAYRTGLQARELLATVFSEARYAVDAALSEQFEGDGDPLTDASVRTARNLAPFRYSDGGTDRYARVMASRDDGNEESIAYLLDDAVLRHVPPAFAYAVYEALENNADPVADGQRPEAYNFDHCANWKQLKVATPTREVSVDGQTKDVSEEVIGRMAWAVVNLSDSLDINAVGSFSPNRGIGLTASEFAFNTDGDDDYALFEENVNADGLPLFASGADLALYAARATSSGYLWRGTGGFFPYSWENAIDAEGLDAYSPFTVYSFWPDVGRETESGKSVTQSTPSGGSSVETIPCNEVNTDSSLLAPGSKLQPYFGAEDALGDNAAADSLVQMLMDYLDKDTVPSDYESAPSQEAFNNAMPTVEPVPMLSEIGYTDADWKSGAAFESALQTAITEAFDGKASKAVQNIDELTTLNVDETLTLELPPATLSASLRTYFPGCAEGEQGDTLFQLEGFAIGYAALAQGPAGSDATLKPNAVTGAAQAAPFTTADALTVPGGEDAGENIYTAAPNVPLTTSGSIGSYTIEGTEIEMSAPSVGGGGQGGQGGGGGGGGSSTASQVTLNLLVDFVFRVKATSGGTVVDLCPAGKGYNAPPSAEGTDYPATLDLRQDVNRMASYDGHYFRVSRTLTATFDLSWADVQGAGTAEEPYKATSKVENLTVDFEPESCQLSESFDVVKAKDATDESSCRVASPASGAWFTIDPRYNWLSPMKGVSDDPTDANYGLASGNGAFLAAFSSPHWLFYEDATVETSSSAASVVQQAYAEAHNGEGGGTGLVPFSWGLDPQDVRYGYNNSGQLLLPEEVGFLPVPYTRNEWTPTGTFDDAGYRGASLQSYYDTVGKASFYRTLPVADFEDGAFGDYDRMVGLTTRFGRFGGENFPEEHRGIVNAFAGMDNYTYGQRLKQFAMLGIPDTITKAAANTYTRLEEAVAAARVSDQMLGELEVLKPDDAQGGGSDEASTTSKYDEFVRNYLFPVDVDASGEIGTDSWEQEYVLAEADESGQQVTGKPTRPTTVEDVIFQEDAEVSLTSKLQGYNGKHDGDKLGQNDLTTLVAVGNSCFGDRQQLFLYILRADTINYSSNRDLAAHKPQTTARAVALVWRDAYGELPDRVVYFQYLP